jgi:hypothetical protein
MARLAAPQPQSLSILAWQCLKSANGFMLPLDLTDNRSGGVRAPAD